MVSRSGRHDWGGGGSLLRLMDSEGERKRRGIPVAIEVGAVAKVAGGVALIAPRAAGAVALVDASAAGAVALVDAKCRRGGGA